MHHDDDFKTEDKTKAIEHIAEGDDHDVTEVTEEDGDVTCRMLEKTVGINQIGEEDEGNSYFDDEIV